MTQVTDDLNVKVVETKRTKMKNPVAMVGLIGPGYVGNVASTQVIISLNMEEIAHIESRLIPPTTTITGGKLVPIQPIQIYCSQQGDYLVIRENDLSSISPAVFRDIGTALVNWLRKKNVKEIIILVGAPAAEGVELKVLGYSTNTRRMQNLQQHDIAQLAEGGISGISAAIIEGSIPKKIPWLILFVTTPMKQLLEINFEAAIKIVDALSNILEVKIGKEALLEQSGHVDEVVKSKGGLLQSFRRFVGGEGT